MYQVYSLTDPKKLRTLTGKTLDVEKNNKLFYGVELEVELKERLNVGCIARDGGGLIWPHGDMEKINRFYEIADCVQSNFGENNAALKWEGTVDCGFEIVTAPATFGYHKEKLWNKFFKDGAKLVEGQSNCGMHIHFSRAGVDDMQLAKAICFIHSKYNEEFVSSVAGRTVSPSVKWCRTKLKSVTDPATNIIKEALYQRDAISISERTNGATVEVRIWASIPTEQGVFQGLEFLDSLLLYCKICDNTDEAMQYKNYIGWLNECKKQKEYTYLDTLLNGLARKNFLSMLMKAS